MTGYRVPAAVVAGKHSVCDKPLGVSLAEYDGPLEATGVGQRWQQPRAM